MGRRGASTTAVQHAGGWRDQQMVARYATAVRVETGAHAVAVDLLPPIHKDSFDRILVAQAQIERFTLLTADEVITRHPGPIRAL